MILEKILGTLKVKENLYRSGRNFTKIETEVNAVGEQINDLDADKANKSELLDYEEGTWTPILKGLTVNGNHAYSEGTVGIYRKIGKMVHVQCVLSVTAKDSAMSGAAVISGLPYVVRSISSLAIGEYTGIDIGSNVSLLARTLSNGLDVRLSKINTSGVRIPLDSIEVGDSIGLYLTGTYAIN